MLSTEFGLTVKWNGETTVEILLDKAAKDQTCGLCGNFNDNPNDDWTVGPSCEGSGQMVIVLIDYQIYQSIH